MGELNIQPNVHTEMHVDDKKSYIINFSITGTDTSNSCFKFFSVRKNTYESLQLKLFHSLSFQTSGGLIYGSPTEVPAQQIILYNSNSRVLRTLNQTNHINSRYGVFAVEESDTVDVYLDLQGGTNIDFKLELDIQHNIYRRCLYDVYNLEKFSNELSATDLNNFIKDKASLTEIVWETVPINNSYLSIGYIAEEDTNGNTILKTNNENLNILSGGTFYNLASNPQIQYDIKQTPTISPKWRVLEKSKLLAVKFTGTSSERVDEVSKYFPYYDTTLKQSLRKLPSGGWVEESTGYLAGTVKSGTFSNKPTVATNFIDIGFQYFCTDKQTLEGLTDGIIIYHKGNNIWVDALGRVIS